MVGAGTRAMAVNDPEESVVTVVGVVVSVVVSNLIVTFVNGARLAPDIEIAVPAGPVDVSNDATGVVPIVKLAFGELVPSDAIMVSSALAVAGTTNLPINPPVVLAVTADTGVSDVLLSLNVIACDGTTLVPVTVND